MWDYTIYIVGAIIVATMLGVNIFRTVRNKRLSLKMKKYGYKKIYTCKVEELVGNIGLICMFGFSAFFQLKILLNNVQFNLIDFSNLSEALIVQIGSICLWIVLVIIIFLRLINRGEIYEEGVATSYGRFISWREVARVFFKEGLLGTEYKVTLSNESGTKYDITVKKEELDYITEIIKERSNAEFAYSTILRG